MSGAPRPGSVPPHAGAEGRPGRQTPPPSARLRHARGSPPVPRGLRRDDATARVRGDAQRQPGPGSRRALPWRRTGQAQFPPQEA